MAANQFQYFVVLNVIIVKRIENNNSVQMKKLIQFTTALFCVICLISCNNQVKKAAENTKAEDNETIITYDRPSTEELHAYKAYHHTRYMVETAKQAGGTNKLLHTKKLPTEGSDPVVTPALDHLYSKAVIDLTESPVTVEFPKGFAKDRYWSIHVTDQEHYTIFDEIRPVGKYTFVRQGKKMEVPEGSTKILCPGDYPHLFIRIQVKSYDDMKNTLASQEKIILSGESKDFIVPETEYVKHVIETHDIYIPNNGMLKKAKDFTIDDYNRVTAYLFKVAPTFPSNMGMFGPITSDEEHSNDPVYRAAAIFGHLGLPAKHAIYFPNFVNCQGEVLNGDRKEVFTFDYTPDGVEEFWSITRYSALTRNTIPDKNDVFNAYNTKPDENGNITITFSSEDPKDETYWMPVVKGEPYYFVVRYYKADLENLPKTHCE